MLMCFDASVEVGRLPRQIIQSVVCNEDFMNDDKCDSLKEIRLVLLAAFRYSLETTLSHKISFSLLHCCIR